MQQYGDFWIIVIYPNTIFQNSFIGAVMFFTYKDMSLDNARKIAYSSYLSFFFFYLCMKLLAKLFAK
jgi:hypothetical protein